MKAARLKKSINILFLCAFLLLAILKYGIKSYFDLKKLPQMMFYYACFVQPLFLLSMGAIAVPLSKLSQLQWTKPWCKYLALFSLVLALGGSLCIIIYLAAFPDGGIMSRIGFRLYATHQRWLIMLGLAWSLCINIYLGRDIK